MGLFIRTINISDIMDIKVHLRMAVMRSFHSRFTCTIIRTFRLVRIFSHTACGESMIGNFWPIELHKRKKNEYIQ